MALDTNYTCADCGEAFHRLSGLEGHRERVHGSLPPPPPPEMDPEDATDVVNHEGLRYTLWNAYLRHRHSAFHLTYEDIRMLDNLSALAASCRSPR